MKKLLSALLFLLITNVQAKETDQFIALTNQLDDSSKELNKKFNSTFEKILDSVNERQESFQSCEAAGSEFFNELRFPFVQIIESWAESSPEVDAYPSRDLSWRDYFSKSVYGNPYFFYPPYYQPIARTIRAGDVHFGTDKLGHFVSLGEKYYQQYLKAKSWGATELDSRLEAITSGINTENGWLGRRVLKVFSLADLEANYQGFLYRWRLCNGRNPLLQESDGVWSLRKPFDITQYANPAWDESTNNSIFGRSAWTRVISENLQSYCDPEYLHALTEREKLYQSTWYNHEKSLSIQVIEKLIKEGQLISPNKFSLQTLCGL